MLRTGNIVLNTSKKHSFAINHIEIFQEGAGWWQGICDVSYPTRSGWWVGVGPHQWHTLTARFRTADLVSWPRCLWLLLAKGKGWFYLQTVKSNLCWIHLEADPEGGAGAELRVAEELSSTRCKKMSSSVNLGRLPSLLSQVLLSFLLGKISGLVL